LINTLFVSAVMVHYLRRVVLLVFIKGFVYIKAFSSQEK